MCEAVGIYNLEDLVGSVFRLDPAQHSPLICILYTILMFQSHESAFRYCLVSAQSLQLLHGHPEVERVKVPFLKLAVSLATSLGHDPRPYNKQLSELRYAGVKTDSTNTLMDVVR